MIDFDDIDEAAGERDDLDEAALAAVACASDGPSSKLREGEEDLSLDDLIGRSARATAAEGNDEEEEAAAAPAKGGARAHPAERDLGIDSGAGAGEADMASLYRGWGSKPGGAAARQGKGDPKSKRLALCELSSSWAAPEDSAAEPPSCEEPRTLYEAPASLGLPTETTAAEAASTREEISSGSEDGDAGAASAAAAAAAEPERAEPAASATAAPATAPPVQWPARPDEAHFSILGHVLPMHLPHEGITPQEVMRIWEEDWGVAYARTLRFGLSSESSSKRWLNPREDAVPLSPEVVRLEGKAGVLNSLALSMRQRDERLRERSGADAARRRLSAKSGGANFGPRVRPAAAAAKRRPGLAFGRGTPFARRQIALNGEED